MGNFYDISKSIRITNADPIDGDRYIAQTTAIRDLLLRDDGPAGVIRAHEGLQVYVKDSVGDNLPPLIPKLYILIDLANEIWVELQLEGSGDKTYEYTAHEVTASDLWTINNHGLNKKPS
ncbi:MAG: hypothetical protein KAH32_05140, partial [Chlamydiia bacterium]|nr:hypothetical protein [Chlamydiia bacterium]